ncbi:glycoside hydrolase family 15 protein [uncultured Jannaschia sp.]|uniref:glycoside hydrolase family 15 protein n=1 Tax=uncultured Jannaschia sp. TaxID=293347 RepID=UPI00262120B8|nr:glycoside hydrolase family 15 protein [uncultured Jannaschia sp.]
MTETPIENHGIIGDLATTALVTLDGTIDHLCWPRFDSPSVFASLLDSERGGAFAITPELPQARHRQLYLPDTNVLLTRFLSEHGVAEISDFMVPQGAGAPQRLVRRIKAIRGEFRVTMRCAPRFDYARAGTHCVAEENGVVMRSTGADATRLRLCANVPLRVEDDAVAADLRLGPGENALFVLQDAATECEADLDAWAVGAFKHCTNFWRDWTDRSTYRGRWRHTVNRSALTLKLLTSAGHGSILAAATFGLPERIGGERNWDYRYTWIRDGAFAVYAFLRLGHRAEAEAFMGWLGTCVAHREEDDAERNGPLHVLYGYDGRTDLPETVLDSLRGHQRSAPVRVGNAAHDQLQLDIYGEPMDAVYLVDKSGHMVPWYAWEGIVRNLTWLEEHWNEPDEGIWEVRGSRRHFLHSRLMCWVAFDRGVRLAVKRSLPAPIERWRSIRDAIRTEIHTQFWNEARGYFVQSLDSEAIDASCLLMPLVRFISPTDPRWLSTLEAVGRELTDDSLVFRYATRDGANDDGLDGLEGTFNMCSFWYVECLARAGDVEQARYLFDKMLGYGNHLGLFAEETGPAGDQLGNFPQAFTHLALISAAHYLDRCLRD